MHEHVLNGCRPVPLANYLKALGVLRLVSEQRDPRARACWRNDRLVLITELDRNALQQYFLDDYRPTPIVAPWNGGSGFYPKDNTDAIDALAKSSALRFYEYRETIALARALLQEQGITEKASGEAKAMLLERCRAEFPDHSLRWLDATYVLSSDGPKYPPLLGTGGNDGRLDFTNNFMQRVLCLMDAATGRPAPSSMCLLRAALFEDPTSDMLKGAPIGQFLPSHAGGANASAGFSAESLINPWDFVLMLEGATAFAAAAVRRMEQEDTGALSYPFTVRPIGAGYASAAKEDEASSRAEIWLPLWERPATASEVGALLSEGRARVGRRAAENGVDFARAIAGLGVDRGIEAFQRYGFQVRNGLAYFAVPLGRFRARRVPRAALLQEVDPWLEAFRWRANSQNAPASARRALRQLDAAILELCAHGDELRLLQVLIALGECERVMATSTRWTEETRVKPIPPLSPDWLRQAYDGSVELRLAASLASVRGRYGSSPSDGRVLSLRRHLEPVATWKSESGLRVRWDIDAKRDVVWSEGDLASAMNAVMHRRLVTAVQVGAPSYPDRGRIAANLGDIADFIERRVDDQRLTALLWGCILLDWTHGVSDYGIGRRSAQIVTPTAFYALLKLCFAGPSRSTRLPAVTAETSSAGENVDVPIEPSIHRVASAGRGGEAARKAIRRLRGSGFMPALKPFEVLGDSAARTAAALLFPIDDHDRKRLAVTILRPGQTRGGTDQHESTQTNGATTR